MNRPATLALWAALGAGLSGCGLNQEGVMPPDGKISFPSAARLDDSGQWLFVVNSNADLRYNDGTAMVLDVAKAAGHRDETPTPFPDCTSTLPQARPEEASCCWDLLDRDILNCDERLYVRSERTVRLGSFAAGMVLQRYCPQLPDPTPDDGAPPPPLACPCGPTMGPPPSRLLIAVRGDTSLTVIDIWPPPVPKDGEPPDPKDGEPPDPNPPPVLRCTGQPGKKPEPGEMLETFASCDKAHRIIETGSGEPSAGGDLAGPEPVRLPDEPYALALDDNRGLLFMGHLTGDQARRGSGGVSVFDVAPTTTGTLSEPRYLGPLFNPFPPNTNGLVGVTSLTWDPAWPDGGGGYSGSVFATSRYLATAVGMGVLNADVCPRGERGIALTSATTFETNLAGEQTRGIQNVDGRTFVLQRNPPALVGFSGTAPADILETCGTPTYLYKYDAGAGPRLFVSCQDSGEVYVYDPRVPRIERTFQVGRSPAGLEFVNRSSGARPVAYVIGFGDNNISVVDLQPGSRTEYHVVQRIGFPSTVPR